MTYSPERTKEKIFSPLIKDPHLFFPLNSAHHIDSHALNNLGVYIPRGYAAKPFEVAFGTSPSKHAINHSPLKNYFTS